MECRPVPAPPWGHRANVEGPGVRKPLLLQALLPSPIPPQQQPILRLAPGLPAASVQLARLPMCRMSLRGG